MSRFGPLLRKWRESRGISQQELALATGISTRHLSFLETGRSGPSEQTVVRLGSQLDLPQREIQRLLDSAGFASQWGASAPGAGATPEQLSKLGPSLAAYDPFPAFITDPSWKIPLLNRSAAALFRHLGATEAREPGEPFDIAAILVDGERLDRIVTNRSALLRRAMSGLFQLAPDPSVVAATERLFARLSTQAPTSSTPPDGRSNLDDDNAGAWAVPACFEDRNHRFALELLAIPFGGPCVGFGLLLTSPVDERSDTEARAYFESLIDDALDAGAERTS